MVASLKGGHDVGQTRLSAQTCANPLLDKSKLEVIIIISSSSVFSLIHCANADLFLHVELITCSHRPVTLKLSADEHLQLAVVNLD